MAVGLNSQERFPVRKWRPRTVLALFPSAGNREWTDHVPSKTRNIYVMINETNLENGVNGTQTYGEGSLPGVTAGGQLQQPVPSRQQTTAQRRLEGSGLKKIIGESWNAIIRVCHVEMDTGNECCKYGLRRKCSM